MVEVELQLKPGFSNSNFITTESLTLQDEDGEKRMLNPSKLIKFIRLPGYISTWGSGYMSNLDINEWRLKRAKRVMEEYIRGRKKKTSDIKWVMGILKGSFGVSKEEALELLKSIENDRSVILTPERMERLKELEKLIKSAEW